MSNQAPGVTYLAVLSPLLGGLAWAGVNVGAIAAFADEPDSDLSVFGLALSGVILGTFGALAVLVPTIGGLCAQDDRGRLGAAAAGAAFASIGGAYWLAIGLDGARLNTNLRIGIQLSTIPLFAPAVFVAWLARAQWRR